MVVIVVGCHLLEGAFQDMLDLLDALLLGGDAEVVSIDERAALWGEGLVVGVDVEEEGSHYASGLRRISADSVQNLPYQCGITP